MKSTTTLTAFLVAALPVFGFSAPGTPKLLIVPVRKTAGSEASPISIGNYLAQECDMDGRVAPIVWSMTDPGFRDAAATGVLKVRMTDNPDKAISLTAAKELGATYVLLYSSHMAVKGLIAHAELYESGRLVWKDSSNSSGIKGGSATSDDTSASVAHTWNLQLVASAFSKLATHPKVVTPNLVKGLNPPKVTTPILPADGAAIVTTKADELLKAGKIEKAITLVRDSIDADPFNPKLRLLVVTLYEQQGDWSAAGDAAKRASDVIPDNLDLRKRSLQDLMKAGRMQEAEDQMNEIMARAPNSESSKLLESQTFLALGDYAKATLALDEAVKKTPSSQCFYWRALSRAAMGGADGVNRDVQEYLKKPFTGEESSDSSKESEKILSDVSNRDISESLSLFQQASLHPNAPEVADRLDQLIRGATARSNFLQQIPCNAQYRESYGALLLAQKLLLVSYVSLQDVLKTGTEESMTDARINLGEAIKSLKSSKRMLADESSHVDVSKPSLDHS